MCRTKSVVPPPSPKKEKGERGGGTSFIPSKKRREKKKPPLKIQFPLKGKEKKGRCKETEKKKVYPYCLKEGMGLLFWGGGEKRGGQPQAR